MDLEAVNDLTHCLCICSYVFTTLAMWIRDVGIFVVTDFKHIAELAYHPTTLYTLVNNPPISSGQPTYLYNLTMNVPTVLTQLTKFGPCQVSIPSCISVALTARRLKANQNFQTLQGGRSIRTWRLLLTPT